MVTTDLTSLPAVQMLDLVRRREIAPLELMDAHIKRIAEVNPRLNAFAHLDLEGAREQAEFLRDLSLPLAGLPITIKSSIDVAGMRCEAGARLRNGYVPQTDAPVVARLRRAGAIVLGVTNVPEFLMAYETDNFLYGRTSHPADPERTPGGSSGGEAAAIASGCSAGGFGSDAGGSVRVPAHFCGICGLKPTAGRIPATGHFPPCTGPFSGLGVVGPMARTVADLQLLFAATAGYDPYDPASAPASLQPAPGVSGLRVGYYDDDGVSPVSAETRAAVERAAAMLRERGLIVEPFRPPMLPQAQKVWWTIFGGCATELMAAVDGYHVADIHPASQDVLRGEPAGSLLFALVEKDGLRAALLEHMERYPILLCPVAAIPAFRHREREWTIGDTTVAYARAFSYSQVFNVLGNPAVVVPMGRSPEGLPIGVQIAGRPWEDEAVLAVAALLSQ